jgi:hypothetical protein
MRRIAIAAIPLLALLLAPGGASAARARHALPAKCAPSSHTLLADSQAQVYLVQESSLSNARSLRACIYGQHKSFLLEDCISGEENVGPIECIKDLHLTLTGTSVAYEQFFGSGKYPFERHASEWYVVVRDVRTGRILHKAPTGTPLTPKSSGNVGVGNVVALVLKDDGSVAWIAKDYGRSAVGPPVGPEGTRLSYFDVYACDKSGTRLLASGTNVDPSSLALSTGATGISGYPSSIAGSTLYWTQGGVSASALLN